jgi:hypothetical protein
MSRVIVRRRLFCIRDEGVSREGEFFGVAQNQFKNVLRLLGSLRGNYYIYLSRQAVGKWGLLSLRKVYSEHGRFIQKGIC